MTQGVQRPRTGTAARRGSRPSIEAVGGELARLESAAEMPRGSDRPPADARSRLKDLGQALRQQSEALAVERRRTAALRTELRRVREELEIVRGAPRNAGG
jgi:hypothetical protein